MFKRVTIWILTQMITISCYKSLKLSQDPYLKEIHDHEGQRGCWAREVVHLSTLWLTHWTLCSGTAQPDNSLSRRHLEQLTPRKAFSRPHAGVAQNLRSRGPQVLVYFSIFQGSSVCRFLLHIHTIGSRTCHPSGIDNSCEFLTGFACLAQLHQNLASNQVQQTCSTRHDTCRYVCPASSPPKNVQMIRVKKRMCRPLREGWKNKSGS